MGMNLPVMAALSGDVDSGGALRDDLIRQPR